MINPHLWIWCNQNCNNRINHLHERAQRIVYNCINNLHERAQRIVYNCINHLHERALRIVYNCINHLHERAQRIVYNDDIPSFEDLLQTDQSINIHHGNIRLLGIDLYKTRNNISSHIMNELFEPRNYRSQTDFTTGPISTVNNGLKSLS